MRPLRPPKHDQALAANGAVATASSSYSSGFGPSGANNGDRKSLNWGNGGGWNDPGQPFPDWLQIDFAGSKTIDEIDVYTLQDNWAGAIEPPQTMTFSQWGLTGYEVQYWDGNAWVTVSGGIVTGNNKVWRKFTFSPLNTTKIRVLTNASVDGYSRLTEVEAYSPATTGASANINWLVTDQLGTPRMIFDQSGALATVKRHDYLPFGEELFAGTSGRTTAQGYSVADGVRQKFTLKERDTETGLDFFGARYYGSTQGRFTSVDPYNIVREAQITAQSDPDQAAVQLAKYLSSPQQWNRYAYVANNPLKYIDPTGQYLELTGDSQADRDDALERIKIMLGKDAASHLYVVEAVDSNNKAHYYVESDKNLGQVGGGQLGGYISEIIASNHGVEFKIADSFTTLNETRTTAGDRCGGACTVGAEESVTGNTQIFVNRNASVYAEQSFKKPINSGKYSGGRPSFEEDIVDAHEFGHAYANAIEGKKLHNSSETNERAREFENLQRGTYPYPARRIRE